MFKPTFSNTESENEMEKTISVDYQPVTPPTTPLSIDAATVTDCFDVSTTDEVLESGKERATSRLFFSGRSVAISLLIGVLALLLSTAFIHKNALANVSLEIEVLNARIRILEHENQLLKSSLEEVEIRFPGDLKLKIDTNMNSAPKDSLSKHQIVGHDETRPTPKTKKVWFGNEVEDRVEVLDKKLSSLPDYCYLTDENDLFYEYNVEICENKRQKLEARNKKLGDKKRNENKQINKLDLDNIWKVENQKSYDEYITETLKSLNDEILEIKKKRSDFVENVDKFDHEKDKSTDVEVEQSSTKLKKSEERRNEGKLQRQKKATSGEWVEKLMNGREEARKKHDSDRQEINWYLKRKNERETHRSDSTGQEL